MSSPRYGTCSGIDLQRSFPNGFFDPRLVNRDDGLAAELADEGPDPDAADTDQRGQVHPRPGEMSAVPRWRDQPIDDDVAHYDHDHGHDGDRLRPVFDRTHEQQSEWQEEVKHGHAERHRAPRAGVAHEVVRD